MKVHLFGTSSSPGCANFGLSQDGEEEFGADAAAFICKDFYVDDGLKSLPTVPEATQLINASQAICDKADLRLHEIVSNKKEVLLAVEIVLGVMWCIENDSFPFRIQLHDHPLTQ